MPDRPIKTALISVYDKTGIVEFARALHSGFGIEIISTGGTAKLLRENGIPVTLVEEVTGFPEILDGRVKTLHPKIFAGILADRDNPEHMRQLAQHGIKPIDMVVVNLYPFEKTVADPNCTFEQAIEMIDIGGVALLRAAAKNHRHVVVVNGADAYNDVLLSLRTAHEGAPDGDQPRLRYAGNTHWGTAKYDAEIAEWLSQQLAKTSSWPVFDVILATNWGKLVYGENPHQSADLWEVGPASGPDLVLAFGDGDDEDRMSLNNYADADAALRLCAELSRSAMWDRLSSRSGPTNARDPSTNNVGPTFQSVLPRIDEETHTRRHLPHIQNPESHYFITFRIAHGELTPAERDIVLNACKYWHRRTMTLHACVVMPDHVHLILTPHEVEEGKWVQIGELTRSIKEYSAREINKLRGTSGSLWMDEVWDRIIRNENEYAERWDYIEDNPEKSGLGGSYRWLWLNHRAWEDLAETDRPFRKAGGQQSTMGDRLESRSHSTDSATEQAKLHATAAEEDDRLESRSHIAEAHRQPLTSRYAAVCTFIKHTNPCGVGVAADPVEAYRRAYLGDPNAAMGGILACNFPIRPEFAEAVMETLQRFGKDAEAAGCKPAPQAFFLEVWLAESFDDNAVKIIRTKKKWGERVRLLAVGDMSVPPDPSELEYRSISGGMLVQTRDLIGLNEADWKVVTKRAPTESELADLRLAWLVAKHTKSNAISIVKDGMLIGNGAGQMSRVMSCRIATWLAKENGHAERLAGSAAASDAFFPFRDGPDILMDAGVTAIIQPGGSKRDDETVAACDERGVAMIFTGVRHFRH